MNNRLPVLLASILMASAVARGASEPGALRVFGKPVSSASAKSMAAPSLRLAAYPQELSSAIRLAPHAARLPEAAYEGEKRTRVGVARDVALESEGAPSPLRWLPASAGGLVARLTLTSPRAAALRIGLAVRALPPGSVLRFSGASGSAPVIGPISGETAVAVARERGAFWTPLTEGETQVVELWIPAAAQPGEVRVTVLTASHIDTAPSSMFKSTGAGASGSCNKDVACGASTDPAMAQAARSVAKMIYTENGSTYLCSATLVNDGDPASQVPYLYTAAHCIDSQAAASTLNTLWFYEATVCGGATGSYRQLSSGATLVYANAARDVALLRLSDAAPEGAWFSGWDAAPLAAGDALLGLHHPAGDLKKASTGETVASDSSFNLAAWKVGTTEGGSSGSGLFTRSGDEYVLRGGLRGGSASCQSSGDVRNLANRDQYSRLDLEITSLAAWLKAAPAAAPTENFTGMWWNPAEPGWGASLVQGATGGVFATVYAYDADGTSMWIAMPDPKWKTARVLEGTLYLTHGQPLEAAYDAAKFSMVAAGTGRIEFAADGTGSLTLIIGGKTLVKPMARFVV